MSSDTSKSPTNKSRGPGYKRPLDILVLIISHVVLLPLWILLWTLIPLVIWLGDRGPIFFQQQRAGKDRNDFTLLKFRTMVPDSDSKGPAWTTAGDLRVTAVGKILRRTALDELPEILSIWKGDMTLVGPRALDVEEHLMLEKEIAGFAERLKVMPGLTGLAQIHDRQDNAHDKYRYDLEYINHMGFWLDIKILVLSVYNTLLGRWDRRVGKVAHFTMPMADSHPPKVNQNDAEKEHSHQDRANTLSS